MEGGDSSEARPRTLPRWGYVVHPYAALAYLLVAAALILVGFHKPRPKPTAAAPAPAAVAKATPAPVAAPPSSAETAEEEDAEAEAASTVEPPREAGAEKGPALRERGVEERKEPPGSKGKSGRETQKVADAAEYEGAIKADLAKCDQLVTKFNDASRQGKGAAATKDLNEVLGEFRTLLQQMRSLNPPAGFERAQTTLSNSVALTRKGLRSKMLYIETGETTQLSKSQEDLESARKQREQGLSLLESAKQEPASGKKETAPAAATPPPQPASPPPPSKPAVKPAAPAPPPPAEVEPENEPGPEEGASPAEPPEGGSQQEPQPANPENPLPFEQ